MGFPITVTLKIDETFASHIDHWLGCHRPLPHFVWHVGPTTLKKDAHMPLDLTMTDEQQVLVTAAPTTAAGHPAPVDGQVQFTVVTGDVTIARVDDLSANIVSGTPGDAEVLVEADADLGAGIVTISDHLTVHVVGAQAANLGLTKAEPTPKP